MTGRNIKTVTLLILPTVYQIEKKLVNDQDDCVQLYQVIRLKYQRSHQVSPGINKCCLHETTAENGCFWIFFRCPTILCVVTIYFSVASAYVFGIVIHSTQSQQ